MILELHFLDGSVKNVNIGDQRIFSNTIEVYCPSSGKHIFIYRRDYLLWWEVSVQKLSIPGDP